MILRRAPIMGVAPQYIAIKQHNKQRKKRKKRGKENEICEHNQNVSIEENRNTKI